MFWQKLKLRIILIIFVTFWFSEYCFAGLYDNKFVPPEGKTLVMVGQDVPTMDDYVSSVGIVPGGFMHYTSIQNMEGIYEPFNNGYGTHYAQHLVDTYPRSVIQTGLYMVDALEDVSAGIYDSNIDKFGQWAKNANVPIYLRIGYEFEGTHNHYDAGQYVQAYRHIVDRLNADGVNNVAYVWHAESLNDAPIENWYPGDDYVDWCGVTYFWPDRNQPAKMIQFAKDHEKPLMAAESSPVNYDTADGEIVWNEWFERYFELVENNDVNALCYINCNWDEVPNYSTWGWGNGRVQDNEFIKQQWIERISGDRYLNSSETLFSDLGFNVIPEPSGLLLMAWGVGMIFSMRRKRC